MPDIDIFDFHRLGDIVCIRSPLVWKPSIHGWLTIELRAGQKGAHCNDELTNSCSRPPGTGPRSGPFFYGRKTADYVPDYRLLAVIRPSAAWRGLRTRRRSRPHAPACELSEPIRLLITKGSPPWW